MSDEERAGRAVNTCFKRGARPAHLRGCEIVTRLVDETSRENVIRAMEVHTPAFIYLCSVKKPSGRGEIESGCNLAGGGVYDCTPQVGGQNH